jgi:hypothetical protein
VTQLSPRPILVIETDAKGSEEKCARLLYDAAREPKEFKAYPNGGEGDEGINDVLVELFEAWIPRSLGRSELESERRGRGGVSSC